MVWDIDKKASNYSLFNHLTFNIKIHHEKYYGENHFSVVDFDIVPISIGASQFNNNYSDSSNEYHCHKAENYSQNFAVDIQRLDVPQTIYYTYDVIFSVNL